MVAESKTTFMPLGAGAEVGRSCMYVQHGDVKLLLDIGVHPAYVGVCGLPFLDLVDLSSIDACFVTHFHLDHAGALPYLTEKTGFRGRVFMTHPTRALLKYLLNDYARVVNSAADTDFYTEEELKRCYAKIEAIDYDQEVKIGGLRVTALNAGHVLGAAMFLLKAQTTLLYTGDYSTEADRHLRPAAPPKRVDILACEATYGTQCHAPRADREARLLRAVEAVVARRGRCLLPVFALGRAQELLLVLDEHWAAHPRLHGVPVLYCSALARRCIGVYQAHAAAASGCAFDLRHVASVDDVRDPPAPCVVLASPGMLQTGLSRRLFERWCSDRRNGVVLAGYAVQGTLAKDLLAAPSDIPALNGTRLPLACSVDAISFSAHVDFPQNAAFIRECAPAALFLVHGEAGEMLRLATALRRDHVYALRNGEKAEIIADHQLAVEVPRLQKGITTQAALITDPNGLRLCLKNDLQKCKLVQIATLPTVSQYIDPLLQSGQLNLNNVLSNSCNNGFQKHFVHQINADSKNTYFEHTMGTDTARKNYSDFDKKNGTTTRSEISQTSSSKSRSSFYDITNMSSETSLIVLDSDSNSDLVINDNRENNSDNELVFSDLSFKSSQKEARKLSETQLANSQLDLNLPLKRNLEKNEESKTRKDDDNAHCIGVNSAFDERTDGLKLDEFEKAFTQEISDKSKFDHDMLKMRDTVTEKSLKHPISLEKDLLKSYGKIQDQNETLNIEIDCHPIQSLSVKKSPQTSKVVNAHLCPYQNNFHKKEESNKLLSLEINNDQEHNILCDDFTSNTLDNRHLYDINNSSVLHSTILVNDINSPEKGDIPPSENLDFTQNSLFLKLPFNAKLSLIKNILHDHFPQIVIRKTKLELLGVTLKIKGDTIYLKWSSSYKNDLLAHTITHILQNIGNTKMMRLCDDGERETLIRMLKNRYSNVSENGSRIFIAENTHTKAIIDGSAVYGDEQMCREIAEIINTVSAIFAL